MKTRVTIGFVLLLVSSLLKSQESSFEKFERYFTWNPDSTSIYVKSDLQSEELIKLPYGTEVERLDEFRDKEAIVFIGELDGTLDRPERLGGYSLKTFWIKVEYKGVTGYALNAEIINFPPFEWNGSYYELEKGRLQGYFKKEIILHERQDSTLVECRYWTSFIDSLAFPDGSYYKVDSFDGCFDRSYHFKEKTLAQVYYIFKTVYTRRVNYAHKAKQENEHPSFSDVSMEKLSFIPAGVSASDGLFIGLSKHLVFGSSDCT